MAGNPDDPRDNGGPDINDLPIKEGQQIDLPTLIGLVIGAAVAGAWTVPQARDFIMDKFEEIMNMYMGDKGGLN